MFVIKPMSHESVRSIEKLMSDDLLGITSLPRNKHFLHQKLNNSISSFAKNLTAPQDEQYYFVLENIQSGEIGGLCGIESKTGVSSPIYSYNIEKILSPETDLPVPRKQLLLHFLEQHNGPSEIGSLYILPSFRKEGLGRLLSLTRFLFMACFLERFDVKTVAEMRGYTDEKGQCPFWNGLGRHFLNIEFLELMNILDDIKDTIPLIVPRYPIYVSLLSEEAQGAIGRVHLNTQPALNLLLQEDFTLTSEVDLFDGGPKIEAITSQIRTVKQSRVATIKDFTHSPIASDSYIICNARLNFCACYSPIQVVDDEHVIIPAEVGLALGVNEGDKIRYVAASTKITMKESS